MRILIPLEKGTGCEGPQGTEVPQRVCDLGVGRRASHTLAKLGLNGAWHLLGGLFSSPRVESAFTGRVSTREALQRAPQLMNYGWGFRKVLRPRSSKAATLGSLERTSGMCVSVGRCGCNRMGHICLFFFPHI